MEDLFKILPKMLDLLEDSEEVREAVVFATWRKTAGDSLSSHTLPISLKDKRLSVAVRDKTWKVHLKSLAGQMIFKLNSLLGSAVVTFIEFRIDEKAVASKLGSFDDQTISDEELKELALEQVSPELRASAEKIDDDELRYQFLLAAGSCLARRKRLSDTK